MYTSQSSRLCTYSYRIPTPPLYIADVGDTVPNVGAPLGLIVADTWAQARRAAKHVVQTLQADASTPSDAAQTQPAVMLGQSDVAAAKISAHRGIGREELVAGVDFTSSSTIAGANGMVTATATFKTGGQRHFYMETQAVCCTPVDAGTKWEVVSSDQDGDTHQQTLALVLGVPAHTINVITPRAGGAFGGKLTRQMIGSTACLVAANKLGKAVRARSSVVVLSFKF
jgi:xanthine dehydrogenase molybdopterin-binding subunit B